MNLRPYLQYNRLQEARALYSTLILQHGNNRTVVTGMLQVLKKQHELAEARRVLDRFSRRATLDQDKAWAREELKKLR